MKPTHIHKLVSLLLALAMTFSLACPAFGAESDTVEALESESASSESVNSDSDDWDTLPVTDTTGEETDDSSAEETPDEAEADEDAADAETEEEAADDAEVEPDAEPETDTDEVTDAADEEEAEEDAVIVAAQDTTVSVGWRQATDDDGDPVWTLYYNTSNSDTAVTQATDVVLYIPEDCTADSATFTAGYYYFDADGLLVADGTTASVGPAVCLNSSFVCDSTASDAGKLYQVTTTQTADSEQTTFSSTASLYTGQYSSNSLWYYNGEIFTGYVRRYASDVVWYVKNGVGGTRLTGQMSSSTPYICMETGAKGVGDGLWYYSGSVFTGYVRRYASDVVWYVKNGVGGTRLTGLMSTSTYYVRMDTGVRSKGDGCYYKNGTVYTGYVSSTCTYYKNGKADTSINGWKTMNNKEYYFTKGVAASGTKRISRNGYTYTYTFRSDGSLVTDLFAYNSSYKKKKLHIVLARGSHTGTILAYNSSTGQYDIPVKSFVISMSRKSSNTKAGTYKLSTRKRWWKYSAKLYYQYATYVSGSGSWTHSEQYSKTSITALKYSSYNGLGTNQSKQCIRMQVVNCKLIYDLASSNNSNTRVVITKGNGYLPFGQMTLSHNYDATGKVKSSQKYDPTDPAV